MVWKQIKIYVADAEQSATIEPNDPDGGVTLLSIDEADKKQRFTLHMSYEEAEVLGEELIRFAGEMKHRAT